VLRRPSRRAASYAVLTAVWLVAVALLWRETATVDVALPEVDPRLYFTDSEIRRVRDYQEVQETLYVLSTLVMLVSLAVYALAGRRMARDSAAGPIGTGMYLGMIGVAIVWLVQTPFALIGLWWARRHGSGDGYLEHLVSGWVGLGAEMLFVCLAILIVMGCARLVGGRWWIPAAPAFVALAVLLAFAYPLLTPTATPDDAQLRRDAERLTSGQGVSDIQVEVQEVGTDPPNAFAAGLGPSRKIVLWSSLLDGAFSDAQVRVVIAHEVAHHARNHVWKSIAWYALLAVPGTFLLAAATRRRGGPRTPVAVPVLLFVLVSLQLVAQPLQNAVSRQMELEADWVALEQTGDPDAARDLFIGFSRTSLEEPEPEAWAHVMLGTHPSLMQRIALAVAWERERDRRRAAGGAAP
jgi:STE24 endopeptidase